MTINQWEKLQERYMSIQGGEVLSHLNAPPLKSR